MQKNNIYVIGHKNPDTDSICASLVYSFIKSKIDTNNKYIPCRAGRINEETTFVLKYFDIKAPIYFGDVRTQIHDIDIRISAGVSEETSLGEAWDLIKERNIFTLPITEPSKDNNGSNTEKLKGVITINDLGKIFLDNEREDLLSESKTAYDTVIKFLNGKIIFKNDEEHITKGRVVVAAGTSAFIGDFVEEGDVIIVSNRIEAQRAAIKSGAGCIIVTIDAKVEDEIIELARANNCSIISTSHDSYIVARLLNKCIPVRYAMKSDDITTFNTSDYLDHVKRVMSKTVYRDFPVIDEAGNYQGMISRRFLVDAKKKRVILVDHNEKSQAVGGIEEADILEIIDHHRLGNIETLSPVYFRNQPLGSTCTILYLMGREVGIDYDEKYAGLLCAGIISDTLLFTSPTCTEVDKTVAFELAKLANIDLNDFASEMFHAGSVHDTDDPESIILRDFKSYNVNEEKLGIGQINFMDQDHLVSIKKIILPALEKVRKANAFDAIFVMLTDIPSNSSIVIFDGQGAEDIIEDAFEITSKDSSVLLSGVVSRKKQFVPEILSVMKD